MKKTKLKGRITMPVVFEVDLPENTQKEPIKRSFTKNDAEIRVDVPKDSFPSVSVWAFEGVYYSYQSVPAILLPGSENDVLIFNNAHELEGTLIIQ